MRVLYLWRNLARNPLRTALTCAAVGLPIMIFVLSAAAIDGINRFLNNSAAQLRLAVAHKTSLANPLPEGYRAKIEALDETRGKRITAVCGIHWIGGHAPNDPRPLSTIGADADTFIATFPEYNLSPDQQERWRRDRAAIVLGSATAAQFKWKEGDRIVIRSSVPPYLPVEFHVISTAPDAADKITNWFRRDYYEELIKEAGVTQGWISFFFVKCATKADLDYFRTRIDQEFEHAPDQTKTLDEKSFMNQFITQQLNLPRRLTLLSAVSVFVAIMAAANTMTMNFRDRIGEFATLKSMGFGGRTILALVQAESLLLCGIGGALGALLPWVLFTFTPLKNQTVPLIQFVLVRLDVVGFGLLISLAIGLLAALWPSWRAQRLHVVDALRNLE